MNAPLEPERIRGCPFCGNADLRVDRITTGHGSSDPAIRCKCGCVLEGIWISETELRRRWNARAEPK